MTAKPALRNQYQVQINTSFVVEGETIALTKQQISQLNRDIERFISTSPLLSGKTYGRVDSRTVVVRHIKRIIQDLSKVT